LDFAHPIWYGLLLALLMANAVPKHKLDYLVILPLIAGLCDLVENFIHFPKAAKFNELRQPWITLGALFASAKWLLVVVSIILFLLWKLF